MGVSTGTAILVGSVLTAAATVGTSLATRPSGGTSAPAVPPAPETLSTENVEQNLQQAERDARRARAAASARAQTQFTSALGAPIRTIPNTFRTALGGGTSRNA